MIPPGSQLVFERGVDLTCQGKLSAPGTRAQPITLTGNAWKGITLSGTRARAVLSYVTISRARKYRGAGMHVDQGASLEARNCTLRGSIVFSDPI